ncbi:MAG: ferredoxin [Pseudomonadota bacterium]|nr:ferredoxin [Pseudomonadota bacterium]
MITKVIIDHSLCEGHAKCMDRLPDVFEVREDDRSYVLIDTIPSDLEEAVQRAAAVCPRAAISCIDSN